LVDKDKDGEADETVSSPISRQAPRPRLQGTELIVAETGKLMSSGHKRRRWRIQEVLTDDILRRRPLDRTVVLGPDSMLYVSVGCCNACVEDDQRRASIPGSRTGPLCSPQGSVTPWAWHGPRENDSGRLTTAGPSRRRPAARRAQQDHTRRGLRLAVLLQGQGGGR
jgi:hypothetical protein